MIKKDSCSVKGVQITQLFDRGSQLELRDTMNAKRQHHCTCQRKFATLNALAQHKRDSPRHSNDQENTASSHDAIFTPNTPNVAASQAATTAEVTPPAPSTIPSSTSTSTSQTQTPSQKKKKNNKKRGQGGGNPYAYGSAGYGGYDRLRRHYNPNWEIEYQMSGPDHTQCSSDCDWCGICAIREPY
ncbi:hypothetical protein F4777DRAFT_555726 [Nemania sp. FL0916]|nr:hypothetical protein F4777DRAFT_555726 [Nemania sp. FL0916]